MISTKIELGRSSAGTYSSRSLPQPRKPNPKPREIWGEGGRGVRTDFEVAAAEIVVAAEAREDPGVPAFPRRGAGGGGDRLAHDDGDPVGAALGRIDQETFLI